MRAAWAGGARIVGQRWISVCVVFKCACHTCTPAPQLRDMHNDVDEIPANDETEIHVLKDESLKLEEKVLVLEEKNSALKEENSRLQGRTRAHLAMEQQHPEENSRLQQENSSISRVQEGLWT
jgi:hypothetical protein